MRTKGKQRTTLDLHLKQINKRISFSKELEGGKKKQSSTFYQYNKIGNQTMTSASTLRNDDQLHTSESADFEALRHEHLGTGRLPGITDLSSSRTRYCS